MLGLEVGFALWLRVVLDLVSRRRRRVHADTLGQRQAHRQVDAVVVDDVGLECNLLAQGRVDQQLGLVEYGSRLAAPWGVRVPGEIRQHQVEGVAIFNREAFSECCWR